MEKQSCPPMIGVDVEGFVYNEVEDKYVPCVGLVPGTKDEPHQLPDLPKGFCIQEDNVMVEFNIPPCTTYQKFEDSLVKVREAVDLMLPPRHSVTYRSVLKFHTKDLTSDQAQTIGCEPDFDAYQGGEMRTDFPALDQWRGAGGHIHIGGDFQCPDFVAAMFADVCIGIQNTIVGAKVDRRTVWYGRPGIYRPKPYGIEYRTPSARWMGMGDYYRYIGASTLALSRWLSESDAKVLQGAFRAINWKRVHNYLTFGPIKTDRANERQNIIEEARRAGAPL